MQVHNKWTHTHTLKISFVRENQLDKARTKSTNKSMYEDKRRIRTHKRTHDMMVPLFTALGRSAARQQWGDLEHVSLQVCVFCKFVPVYCAEYM